ncbi:MULTISPECIES: PadR family transcriptional regulator [unclassified Streptomyces]|uniref:PadR family transcriptional regulator n=1 Tax=unclassified Streptomyces TaxID=2593676 RepID=UPI0038162B82
MSLRHAVLGLLTERPASGYDLLGRFQTSLVNVWPATQSQLYTELNRLADAGLVAVTAEGPRGRKEYTLTDEGRRELLHWLVEVEPQRVRRSDGLLRVFFLNQVAPEQARTYVEREGTTAVAYHQELAELERTVDWDEGDLSFYGRLALEWGLRFTRMQEEWAQWASERIAERTSERPPQP